MDNSNTQNEKRPTIGLRHVALNVVRLEACVQFYNELLGMRIEWQPDENNVYLTSGSDNLALHRAPDGFLPSPFQHLDHMGFILDAPDQVDVWYDFFQKKNVTLKTAPRTHRDGARSFYCADPDGNSIQMIYHPPLVKK